MRSLQEAAHAPAVSIFVLAIIESAEPGATSNEAAQTNTNWYVFERPVHGSLRNKNHLYPPIV